MHFPVCHNALPVVVAVLVILISWYLWRRTFKAPSSNSGEEQTDSGREKIQSLAAEQKNEEDDEVTFEEAEKLLRGAGIIKSKDIQYLQENEREDLSRETVDEPLTEKEQKKRIKEMTMGDAFNIQTMFKSSRLGIKEVENQMTKEELDQEREMQRKQLEEIFKLLETDKDKYGVTTMDDLQAQMKLYTK
ncbi:hypothetical protein ACROYT_G038315 [Oculina patagonica]